ncbi:MULTISPECIES: hypothetical protein [unclassified Corynebacterium]|uniref:hypothetical protein n=1 Tax=unclassified Corynebacterium TaxID=2624378 RepID=UPI0029C9FBAF|nr:MULTISPECIES: hypothetical protein [unclassified Corynebacterium]WPF67090.1 hypothetical protein OLX12_05075 [Corynebacterium sp. 22KM0430]WPF69578.1 hypothetical protein OLW90_05070 [Corynebacterium sp. 21KM1197]
MKRTFAAATIAMSLTAGALAPAASAQTSQFLDEGRTVFDDAQCPSTAKSENEFLGKKQSIFDKCTKQEKKPKEKPSSTSEAAKPSEEAETTAPSEPSEKPAPEKQDPAKPAKKSPLGDIDKEKLKEQVQGSIEGYKTVQPLVKGVMKVLRIVRKIFIPFP